MDRLLRCLTVVCLGMFAFGALAEEPFRPPSVPLIVSDPALSIWSPGDRAFDAVPVHWSGAKTAMVVLLRVDGMSYQLLGKDTFSGLCDEKTPLLKPAKQLSLKVLPLSTIYQFAAGGVMVNLTFTTTATPDNLEVFSRGTTYITYSAAAIDGQLHDVQLYYDTTAQVTVNSDSAIVGWSRYSSDNGMQALKIGSEEENFFGQKGDMIRTSWGYLFLAFPPDQSVQTTMTAFFNSQCAFVNGQRMPADDVSGPRACKDRYPVMAASWDLGIVEAQAVSRHMVIFYDDVFSIQFFGLNLPAYWRHVYKNDPLKLAIQALNDYEKLMANIEEYNSKLMKDLIAAGGWRYAAVTALVYRQVFGAMKLAWHPYRREMWGFQKEMSTCGGVNTIDVLYPASPQFLYTNPELLRICLVPLLAYSSDDVRGAVKYNLQWPTHCLGTWPVCDMTPNGQEQLPTEVAADLILMLTAVAQRQQNNVKYLMPFKSMLRTYADYIVSQLPFPKLQKCTDDFEGPSANNTNLALKAVISLEAYAILLEMMGEKEEAQIYRAESKVNLDAWLLYAVEGSGPTLHYRREFQLKNSFSIKYNLIYQMILNVTVFPQSVIDTELFYYATRKSEEYGVPMDDRHHFTLTEYQGLLAALAQPNSIFRQQFIDQLFRFANTTEPRIPLVDYYYTSTAKGAIGGNFVARPTVGDLFAVLMFPNHP